ncbi:MAG: HD domain-containing protein [Bacteroidales bacterium]|nr:HD domain-containing protein [Bacteroidales bacterium]MDI9532339.1 HD domain-containing protein [Bacteroidota bacterium]OPZ54090.1 MAG: HD domain protein [Bacteroidetes bacterium ADurb.BinA012]MBP7035857.1 HD domain-containing protein [Bacteroidales bacterium]MZQ79758.1 HD domain-containing protein [Bacteroidales bacterium]
MTNKRKIINDPVYGFISVPNEFIYDLISHQWFQRLRNIRQLGLSSFVYPGAVHSRFQHSLGAMYLTGQAVHTLRRKGIDVSAEEEEGVLAAILLHDIGHGPFSHALEHSLIEEMPHEAMSLLIMEELNKTMGGRLTTAIAIFRGEYPRRFFHDLVTGQMDMDRMDYLRRDSFFTGVIEGSVGSDRIIQMLNVSDDRLVVDEKGIYSVEKFLIARRMMYWQVYNHRTVVSAEKLITNLLKRARQVTAAGVKLFATPALAYFLEPRNNRAEGEERASLVGHFTALDESDIISATKVWMNCGDRVLEELCRRFVNRDLLAIELQRTPFHPARVSETARMAKEVLGLTDDEVGYLVNTGDVYNQTYAPGTPEVRILLKNGTTQDITAVSDLFDKDALSEKVTKYYLCYPKEILK